MRNDGAVRAAVLGLSVAALVALTTFSASWQGSAVRAGAPETSDLPSAVFLAAASCAFVLYVVGLFFVRSRRTRVAVVCAIAAVIHAVWMSGRAINSTKTPR